MSDRNSADVTELIYTVKKTLTSFSASTNGQQIDGKEKKLERLQSLTVQWAQLLALPVQDDMTKASLSNITAELKSIQAGLLYS